MLTLSLIHISSDDHDDVLATELLEFGDDLRHERLAVSYTHLAAALQEQLGALPTALTGAQNEAAAATQKAAAAQEAAEQDGSPIGDHGDGFLNRNNFCHGYVPS